MTTTYSAPSRALEAATDRLVAVRVALADAVDAGDRRAVAVLRVVEAQAAARLDALVRADLEAELSRILGR